MSDKEYYLEHVKCPHCGVKFEAMSKMAGGHLTVMCPADCFDGEPFGFCPWNHRIDKSEVDIHLKTTAPMEDK